MQDGYFGDWAVDLSQHNQGDRARSNNLNLFLRGQERKADLERMNRKESEMDEWRRLKLIQDLTDLSTHQTGSDVANAIGNKQAATILQKYTSAATKMSPSELQANISKDMSGIVQGMDAAKTELEQADEQLKLLKQQMPELDISSLAKDYRTEILGRRLRGENFVNPLEVPLSQFDITNPEFVADYVQGNKNLTQAIIAPQGLEETSVFVGNPDSHTKFSAKIPYWKKPNYDPSTLSAGFLPKSQAEPRLQIKGGALPSDALPSSNGKPFNLVDPDVYEKFASDYKQNLELISQTKKLFPNYGNFSPVEKEYAKRHTLYRAIESLDQSNFHPTASVRPARTNNYNTINMGGQSLVNDLYGRISDAVDEKFMFTRFNKLKGDEQMVILDYVNKDRGQDDKLGVDEIALHKNENGDIEIYKTEEGKLNPEIKSKKNLVTTLPRVGLNLKVQPDVKAKRAVVAQGQTTEPKPKSKNDPLGLFD